MKTVGVLAIQGDFTKHQDSLSRLGVQNIEVRTAEDLRHVSRLIIPGGESSTVGLLLKRFGLGSAIVEAAEAGMPIWGTCMGLILMARKIEDHAQYTLNLLDITVRRNAFGAQVHSFEDEVDLIGIGSIFGVFIRAPIVVEAGPSVQALATFRGQIVAVQSGALLGTSFHPELTEDDRLHEYFLKL